MLEQNIFVSYFAALLNFFVINFVFIQAVRDNKQLKRQSAILISTLTTKVVDIDLVSEIASLNKKGSAVSRVNLGIPSIEPVFLISSFSFFTGIAKCLQLLQ